MPSKAAQVLGEEPRNPTKVAVRTNKPLSYANTPTKTPRSDTSKSLPSKMLNQGSHTWNHHSTSARRNRAASRRSPRGSKQTSQSDKIPLLPIASASFESAAPPTPPAKDTPPDSKDAVRAASPLRRTAPGNNRLREEYQAKVDESAPIPFPAFALSPSPSKHYSAEHAGKSPTKYLPYTATEYAKLIAGEPLPWSSVESTGQEGSPQDRKVSPLRFSPMGGNLAGPMGMPAKRWSEEEDAEYYGRYGEQKQTHSAPLEGENRDSLHTQPRNERRSEDYVQSNRVSRYDTLPPRFYSPSLRSVPPFAEGETPSKNVSTCCSNLL